MAKAKSERSEEAATSKSITAATSEAEILKFLHSQGINDLEALVHNVHQRLKNSTDEDDEPESLDIYNTPWNTFLHTLDAEVQ